MALEFHTQNTLNPTDLVNNPEDLQRVSITHDGVSVSYRHDDKGWYKFREYGSMMNSCPYKCIDVTPETVIAELIRAIALSMEESVEVWLS